MRRPTNLLVAVLLASSTVLAPLGAGAAAQRLVGRPSAVTDGDTLRFGSIRVRLAGIDAPEMSTSYGAASRAFLEQLVSGMELRCVDLGQRSYDRVVARCYLPGDQDLGSAMVAAGWAFDWPTYSHGAYRALELQARVFRRGIFSASPLAAREQYHPRDR